MCSQDSSCSAHFMLSICLMKVADQISEIQISACWPVLVTKNELDAVDILKYIECSVIHLLSVMKYLRCNEMTTPHVIIPPGSCAAENDAVFSFFRKDAPPLILLDNIIINSDTFSWKLTHHSEDPFWATLLPRSDETIHWTPDSSEPDGQL